MDKEYWEIYRGVMDILNAYGLNGTDAFIHECVCRVQQDADSDWNEDDIRIAVRNQLNEMIERSENNV